jgi:amino acid adenylation domain-containing protein
LAVVTTARAEGAPAPLSFGQAALFVMHELLPDSPLYNVPCTWRIRGPLDVPAFARAWEGLASRHEILRTSFVGSEDGLMQMPGDAIPPLERVDLAGQPEEVALEVVRERARRPFAPRVAPPLGATLIRLGPAEHILVLVLHHILTDGLSTGIIERDLGELYRAERDGDRPQLPELTLQYGDFAAWQRQSLTPEALEAEVEHWRDVLDGVPPTLDLPTDRRRDAEADFVGDFLAVPLPLGLGKRLNVIGREHGATLNMVLLAAFEVLLLRHTQQRTFVVGCPVGGRERMEFEDLVGFFNNTVCIRADLRPEQSFGEVLRSARKRTIEAIDHQGLPFEALVAALAPERSLNRNPLFQVHFDFIPAEEGPPSWPGLVVSRMGVGHETSKFDLTLFATVGADGEPSLEFEYRTALFDRDRLERLAGHLRTLLLAIAEDPVMPVGRLAMLTDREERELLRMGIPRRGEGGPEKSWLERFCEAAASRPREIAVRDRKEECTFAELETRARRIAAALIAAGVGRGERVGICVVRSTDMVAAPLGVALAGAAFVPVDSDYPDARIADILGDAGVRCTLVDTTTEERLAALTPVGIPVRQPEGPAPDLPRVGGEDLAYVLYTSGSTGRPKGVMVEHRQVGSLFERFSDLIPDAPQVWRAVTSNAFDVSVTELLWTMTTGRRVEIVEDPLATGAGEATAMQCTPSLAKLLLASEVGREVFRRLECVVLAGEVLPTGVAKELLELVDGRVINAYGPTETTIYATAEVVRPGSDEVTIGTSFPGIGTFVVDRQGELVPIGVPGELWLTGPVVTRGYLGRPGTSAEYFVPDPFSGAAGARAYRTGDLTAWRPDGKLRFLGRLDDQVKISGVRVEPAEAEAVLRGHPGIADAVVIAHRIGAGGLGLVAFVIREGEGSPGDDELRRVAAERLPEAAVPVHYVDLEAMPLLTSGKVDRKALRQLAPAGLVAVTEEEAMAGDPEQHIRAAWERALGRSGIGLDDNFFDSGGRSILLLDVFEELRARGYTDLSIVDLYRLPTIRSLAAQLRGGAEEGEEPRNSARDRGRARRMALRARAER